MATEDMRQLLHARAKDGLMLQIKNILSSRLSFSNGLCRRGQRRVRDSTPSGLQTETSSFKWGSESVPCQRLSSKTKEAASEQQPTIFDDYRALVGQQ